jgi:hypothetical protein
MVRLAPSSRSIDARRSGEVPEQPQGGPEPGEPTKAARPDAELRGTDEGCEAGSGASRTWPTPKGRSRFGPRRHVFGRVAGNAPIIAVTSAQVAWST